MSEEPEQLMEEVEIELTDEQFLYIAKMAHENDITFNKQMELILRRAMETNFDALERLKDD